MSEHTKNQTQGILTICIDPKGYGEDCCRKSKVPCSELTECTKFSGGCNFQKEIKLTVISSSLPE